MNNQNPSQKKIKEQDVKLATKHTANTLFEKVLFYEFYWYFIYLLIEIISFSFKANYLPYPGGMFGMDRLIMICFAIGLTVRVALGKIGNKSEDSGTIMKFTILSLPIIFLYIYLMFWQTFVLRLELIINLIGLIFAILGTVFSLLAFLGSLKAEKNQ